MLCYHGVSDTWPSVLGVSAGRLRSQLDQLRRAGYHGATFEQAIRDDATEKLVAVTFDDAFRSVFDRALPVLEELGWPGTVFVPTDFVGQTEPMSWPGIEEWVGTRYENELVPMTWAQLREAGDCGWEIGSHSRSHPDLTELDDGVLEDELRRSRECLQDELGHPCKSLAYPYGAYDARIRESARAAGYRAAAGLHPGDRDRWHWPRVGIYPIDGPVRFRLKVSGPVGRFRNTRVGRLIERARSAPPGSSRSFPKRSSRRAARTSR